MLASISQYILLGAFALTTNIAGMTNHIKPRIGLETQYFMSNNEPIFQGNMSDYATGILHLKTELTCFKFIDYTIGTRGWFGPGHFMAGGMNWGVRLRLTPHLSTYFRHDSIHAFDRNERAWSQNQVGIMIHYGFDESGYSDLISTIRGK